MIYINGVSTLGRIDFMPEPNVEGFYLFNYNPVTLGSPLMIVQWVGFAVVVSGLALAARQRIADCKKVHVAKI